jgi:AraC-like DNA-binding protein
MTNPPSTFKVFFGEITNLSAEENEKIMPLEPCMGRGFVQIFNFEEGIQARFWDCTLDPGVETHGSNVSGFKNSYFTLVFFVDKKSISSNNNGGTRQERKIWDSVFISSKSKYKLRFLPNMEGGCLSISFSQKWLNDNILNPENSLKNLKEKIQKTDTFPLLEYMDFAQKKAILTLFNSPSKKSFGSFYVKSLVLKVISDFFIKVKEKNDTGSNSMCLNSVINLAEEHLISNLTGPLPNLKELATRLSISESTLKRHFKNKFGVNMSSYFNLRKLEFARQLMQEKNVAAD